MLSRAGRRAQPRALRGGVPADRSRRAASAAARSRGESLSPRCAAPRRREAERPRRTLRARTRPRRGPGRRRRGGRARSAAARGRTIRSRAATGARRSRWPRSTPLASCHASGSWISASRISAPSSGGRELAEDAPPASRDEARVEVRLVAQRPAARRARSACRPRAASRAAARTGSPASTGRTPRRARVLPRNSARSSASRSYRARRSGAARRSRRSARSVSQILMRAIEGSLQHAFLDDAVERV